MPDCALVVIPCLNEVNNLERILVQFLDDQSVGEIIVVDGGSTDGSREIVDRFTEKGTRVALLDNPDRIQSAGVNRAVHHAGGRYGAIVRVDAHCLYPNNYVSMLLKIARVQEADCVVVPMRTIGISGFQIAVAAAQNSVLGTGGASHRMGTHSKWVDHGHHALMMTEAFIRAGGYCENMPCNEDAELDFRISHRGGRIWLACEARIDYLPRDTIKGLGRQYYRYGVGRARNLRRHGMALRLRQLVPVAISTAAMVVPFAIFKPLLAIPALLWLSACLLFGLVLGVKARSPWVAASGIAAAIMQLCWGFGFLRAFAFRGEKDYARYGFAEV